MLDSLEFNTSFGAEPSMVSVGPNIYAVAYRGPSGDGFVATISLE